MGRLCAEKWMKHPAISEESRNFVAVNSNNKFAEWTNIYPMSFEPRAELPCDMKENNHFGEI